MEFGQQVNNFERIPLGTPPQMLLMSLAQNHVTNFFISSYRGAIVIKFGLYNQLCDRSGHSSIVTSLPFHHVTLINFYISNYREVTGLRSTTQRLRSSSTSCFKYFLIIKFKEFCKKDKCCRNS